MNIRWAAEEKPTFPTRMGINTGMCQVGLLGSSLRMDYSMIGDNVNLASRLEALNKMYGTSVCISENTWQGLGEGFVYRMLDLVRVKGKARPVTVFELVGHRDMGVPEADIELAEESEGAFGKYLEGDFAGAHKAFEALAQRFPDDQVSRAFADRCQTYTEHPPEGEWDGVFVMTTK